MISPIILSDEVQLALNSKVDCEPIKLANPYRTPMLIDEIRVRAPFLTNNHDPTTQLDLAPFVTKLRLSLGEMVVTKEFTPLALLGKVLDQGDFAGVSGASFTPYTALPYSLSNHYRSWKLPKPLYIPAGEYLKATFFYDLTNMGLQYADPEFITFPIGKARIVYLGRSLASDAPPPPVISVPWVAYYEGSLFNTPGQSDLSSESDLCNPHDAPFKIQRFNGRIAMQAGANSNGRFGDVFWPNASVNTLPQSPLQDNSIFDVKVSMTDSQGRHFVPAGTPFYNLFNRTTSSWESGGSLPPKSFVTAALDYNYDAATYLGDTYSAKAMIAMLGHRDVQLLK